MVVISSGHAKYVAGASCFINEVEEARKVVDKVTDLLQNSGVTVHKYHDNTSKTQRDNINSIVRFHNSKKRELDVSVHFNAFKKTDVPRGVEVLYYSESGRKVAEKVAAAISKASGLINRGAKRRTDLGFLKGTNKTAILIEVCFVDSKEDVTIYQNKFDAICKAIAESITGKSNDSVLTKPKEQPKPQPKPVQKKKPSGNPNIRKFQEWLNKQYNAGLVVDGIYGPRTKKAAIKGLQTELNKQFGARLKVDGIWGPKTRNATVTVRTGAKGNITKLIQGMLHCKGYNPGKIDGIFGRGTADSVLAFQRDNKLAQDAIVGKWTFEKLFA